VTEIASQSHSINRYKDLKIKLINCNANILFNKQCITENIIPAYATLEISRTSSAATTIQRKVQTLRIKEEIKFLYLKKEHLNRELYNTHLQAANEWGPTYMGPHLEQYTPTSSRNGSSQTLNHAAQDQETNCPQNQHLNPYPHLPPTYSQRNKH
jgi:hypothetical protein